MTKNLIDKKKSGWVALLGKTNQGKSTLFNACIGSDLAAVTPKSQTTRKTIRGIINHPSGQMIFLDTPGVDPRFLLQEGAFRKVLWKQIQNAWIDTDIFWLVTDVFEWKRFLNFYERNKKLGSKPTLSDLFSFFPKKVLNNKNTFWVMNKKDLLRKNEKAVLVQTIQEWFPDLKNRFFLVSAKTKAGMDALLKASWDVLPKGTAYFSDTEIFSDQPLKFFVEEKIQKALFLHLEKEIPYQCAAEVTSFKEKKEITVIEVCIFVEKRAQKKIVIGHQGAMLKKIGSFTRKELENWLKKPVFLSLWVKVLPKWTKKMQYVKYLGYAKP